MSKRNKIISISIFYLQKLKFLTWLSDGIDHRPSNWLLDSLWYADNDLIYDKVVLSLALSVITEKNNYTFGLEKESKKIKQSSSPRYKSLSSTLHWTQEGYLEELTRFSSCLNAKTGFVNFWSVYQ